MEAPRSRKRWIIGFLVGAVLGGIPTLVVTAPWTVDGRLFGWIVERSLPELRGRVHIGGGRWSWGGVFALLRERPAAVALRDVKLLDPTHAVVFHADRLTARLELHRRESRVIVRRLILEGAGWRVAELGAGGPIGLVEALTPTRAGPDGSPFAIEISDAVLLRTSATFDLSDWGLRLDGVRAASASFSYTRSEAGPAKLSFTVRGADARDGGQVRVGPHASPWIVPFSRARIDDVAKTDDAPDAIRVTARDLRAGQSEVDLTAVFHGVFAVAGAPSVAPGLSLKVGARHAGALVDALLAQRLTRRDASVAGPDAVLDVVLDGPYERLQATVKAAGFQARLRKLRFDDLAFRMQAALADGRFRIDGLSVGVPGVGRLSGAMAIDDAWKEPTLRLRTLTLTRPPSGPGPRVVHLRTRDGRRRPVDAALALDVGTLKFAGGALLVRDLEVPLGTGRLKATGAIVLRDRKTRSWLSSPVADLKLQIVGIDLADAFGTSFTSGLVSCQAVVRGPLWDLAFDLTFPRGQTLTVFGEPFQFPRHRSFVLTEGSAYVHATLRGKRRTAIQATGRVNLAGRLDLAIDLRDFPLERLPAVTDVGLGITGEISGGVRVTGTIEDPQWAGKLWIFPVTLQGREVGDGALTFATQRSTVHVWGRLMDGVDVDGLLDVGRGGPRGQVTLTMDRLRVDPPVAPMPGLAISTTVSGVLVGRVGPGGNPSLQGRLSSLALAIERPPAPREAPRPLKLRSTSAAALAVQAGGPISLGPVALTGDVGSVEVVLRAEDDLVTTRLHGHLDAARLAPLVSPWLVRPEGALSIDLAASMRTGHEPVALDGFVTITQPLSFDLATSPVSVRLAKGSLLFADRRIEGVALPVTFAVTPPEPTPVSRIDGAARVDARLTRGPSSTRLRGVLNVQTLRLFAPLVSPHPILSEGGHVAIDGELSQLDEAAVTSIDLPLRGRARFTTPAGPIERASFDLRLRGAHDRPFTLSGDVDVSMAHLRAARAETARTAAAVTTRPPAPVRMRNPRLEVDVHARRGAVEVEIGALPNLHVDLDLRAAGTLADPTLTGDVRPTGLYTRVVMALQRILR